MSPVTIALCAVPLVAVAGYVMYRDRVRVVHSIVAFAALLLVCAALLPSSIVYQVQDAWSAWIGMCAMWAVAAVIDIREKRLPDQLTLAGFPLLIAALIPVAADAGSWSVLGRAIGAGLVSMVVYFLLGYFARGQLGLGDVKLALTTGVFMGWFGWGAVLAGHTAGFVLFAIVGIAMSASRRSGPKDELPFGPFMMVGALAGPAISMLLF